MKKRSPLRKRSRKDDFDVVMEAEYEVIETRLRTTVEETAMAAS
ncbi:MAG: hypothetical protein ACLVKA_01580 [Collinsella aerofaciens]